MDNLDDSETNAKISDSAYSNSCSNSQSRRSHSSKSTHSGSNSSGSSGYGGKPSNSGSNNTQPPKKDKDTKKKKLVLTETKVAEAAPDVDVDRPKEPDPIFATPIEQRNDVVNSTPALVASEISSEEIDISAQRGSDNEEAITTLQAISAGAAYESSATSDDPDGFSCVISMHDGVVLHSTHSITKTLGFPKDMWIGRSFIDFVHPKDRDMFATHMSSDLVPKHGNDAQNKKASALATESSIICRLRRYRGLKASFGVKDRAIAFMPFMLKITYKNMNAGKEGKMLYLVIQASPFVSAYKFPNEVVTKPIPFVIRHTSNGHLEYIDPQSVPYLGYLPQDVKDKNIVQLFHPEDLHYLKLIYERIVREGSVSRSKTYRMMAHNGSYVKLETEWSSFTNPWSKKLEFVIGKHHVIEGPSHPDVLKSGDRRPRMQYEMRNRVQALRDGIIKVMNDVMTKTAETAKLQLTERCQDLSCFMDSLIKTTSKANDDVGMEMPESDNVFYERGDSVMLGGISPHHEYDTNKMNMGTPLSYTQLNYNDNLQRYFDSHQSNSFEDYKMVIDESVVRLNNVKPVSTKCMSPSAHDSGDSNMSSCEFTSIDLNASSPGSSPKSYHRVSLTEAVLLKHNAEMESELVKMHRENRSSSRGEREKTTNENRQMKKEHLARCNASFQSTLTDGPILSKLQQSTPAVKRPSEQRDSEASPAKQLCSSPHQSHRRPPATDAPAQETTTITSSLGTTQWPVNHVGNMNHYLLRMPQQMAVMPPQSLPDMASIAATTGMHGMYPIYYAPAIASSGGSTISHSIHPTMVQPEDHSIDPAMAAMPSTSSQQFPSTSNAPQFQQPQYYNPVPCMMYGHPMYGQPFVYSAMHPQIQHPIQRPMQPIQHPMMHQMEDLTSRPSKYAKSSPFDLTEKNFVEALKPAPPPAPREKKRQRPSLSTFKPLAPLKEECGAHSSVTAIRNPAKFPTEHVQTSSNSLSTKVHLFRTSEPVPETNFMRYGTSNTRSSDDTADKTDGESSYSSFYSSFLKTDSGSAEESSDHNRKSETGDGAKNRFWVKTRNDEGKSLHSWNEDNHYYEPKPVANLGLKKSDPPWMEQVSVTNDLLYKYQITTRPLEQVLAEDKEKILAMEQSPIITDQLEQLYTDLHLEGVAARLNLEDHITSSSSSDEEEIETTKSRNKYPYSRLVMIYEEDAPLPPPHSDPEANTYAPNI